MISLMNGKRILLVEDDQFILELYKRQIELAGFTVEAVFSGKTGLELINQNTYDLIMLDINIPDVNGLKLLAALKKGPRSETPVLILSNISDQSLISQAMDLGANSYIVKNTYTPAQVVDEVKLQLK